MEEDNGFRIFQQANLVSLDDEEIVGNLMLDVKVDVANSSKKYAIKPCRSAPFRDPTETNSGDYTIFKLIYEELNGKIHESEFLFPDDKESCEFTSDSMPSLVVRVRRVGEFYHPNFPEPELNSTYLSIRVYKERNKSGEDMINNRIGSLLARLEWDAKKQSLAWNDEKNQNRLIFSRRLIN